MKFEYDGKSNTDTLVQTDQLATEEQKTTLKKKLYAAARKEKEGRDEKISLLVAIANPKEKEKTVGLTIKAATTVLSSELTPENVNHEPYKDFSQEEKEFFDMKKHSNVYGLHEQVMQDENLSSGVVALKKEGMYDGRKQRHKKKPGEYVSSIASFKLLFDVLKRQAEQEKQIAVLAYEVQRNKELVDEKLEQIGQELLVQKQLNALFALGVSPKKLEVYKLYLEDNSLTRQQLADTVGKSKPTVIKWLKEVRTHLAKLDKSLPR